MMHALATVLVLLAVAPAAAHAETSWLPEGFLGNWCVAKREDGLLAHRREVVGPCRGSFLNVRGHSFVWDKDRCRIDEALRTMVHTQLIRYTCKGGKKGVVQLIKERPAETETGLETMYIDAATEAEWKHWQEFYNPNKPPPGDPVPSTYRPNYR
jgi:hypothetical protein